MNQKNIEAIIILSHLMDSEGTLDIESKLRAAKGIEIYLCNIQSKLITCGWDYRKDSNIKIAHSMSHYLIKNFLIPKEKIICEINSRDTVGDAIFTRKNIIPRYNFKNLAVITSSYHTARAKTIFDFVYGDSFNISFYSHKVKKTKGLIQSEKMSLNKFKETFAGIERGMIEKIYTRLIESHPFYNGDILSYP